MVIYILETPGSNLGHDAGCSDIFLMVFLKNTRPEHHPKLQTLPFVFFPIRHSPVILKSALYTWCVQVLRSPKEAFAAAMQSWRERCEKCVCLQADYVEK